MKSFNYSFLKTNRISNEVLSLFVSIERIQGHEFLNKQMYPKVFENLQEISNDRSIISSSLIDGLETSDKDIDLGYRDVLVEIHSNHSNYQFKEYDLLSFHDKLFSYTGIYHGGSYKREDNIVVETLIDGTKRNIFEPVASNETRKAIDELISAYKEADDDPSIPKLLLIPCVILDFLCIYPFIEGNGRMSRLLSLFLLYNSNYNVGKYVSYENQINNSKTEYFESIRLSSVNWHENTNDYNPFILNFLKSLYSCHIELNSRFNIVGREKKSKKYRIEETIRNSDFAISRKEIYEIWPDIAQETIKKVIKNLLNDNKIMKIGSFKDARYKRNWYDKTTQKDDSMVIF